MGENTISATDALFIPYAELIHGPQKGCVKGWNDRNIFIDLGQSLNPGSTGQRQNDLGLVGKGQEFFHPVPFTLAFNGFDFYKWRRIIRSTGLLNGSSQSLGLFFATGQADGNTGAASQDQYFFIPGQRLNNFIKGRTEELAKLGYIAFAIDMYGKGVSTKDPKRAGELSGIFTKDRKSMRSRAAVGLEVLKKHPLADAVHIAAIGYCFGGTTVLELARSGANIAGVVSFHGGLDTPNPDDAKNIKGSVLVLHGADDPFQPREKVEAFQDEMKKAGIDWEMNLYGNAEHSFTNPEADTYGIKGVAYNEKAARRSWQAMEDFFREIFQ